MIEGCRPRLRTSLQVWHSPGRGGLFLEFPIVSKPILDPKQPVSMSKDQHGLLNNWLGGVVKAILVENIQQPTASPRRRAKYIFYRLEDPAQQPAGKAGEDTAKSYVEWGIQQLDSLAQAEIRSLRALRATNGFREWLPELGSKDPRRRAKAARKLGALAEEPGVCVPALIGALGDESLRVRRRAIEALGRFGSSARQSSEALARLLGDSELGGWAAEALRQQGQSGQSALAHALKTGDASARSNAAQAFGTDYIADSAGDLLIGALEDPEPEVRGRAAVALERAGVQANLAASKLSELAGSDSDRRVRRWALRALVATAPSEAASVLSRCLDDGAVEVRLEAIDGLGRIGAASEKVIPRLLDLLGDPEIMVVQEVIAALGMLGPAAAEAVPDLLTLLDHENWEVRLLAARALGEIGNRDGGTIDALDQGLSDPIEDVALEANSALQRLRGNRSKPE
jgi:HEAT repeat protein